MMLKSGYSIYTSFHPRYEPTVIREYPCKAWKSTSYTYQDHCGCGVDPGHEYIHSFPSVSPSAGQSASGIGVMPVGPGVMPVEPKFMLGCC
jgi:hypothetical protein